MPQKKLAEFNPVVFLAIAGIGKTVVHIDAKEAFSRQGDTADATYYLREGKAKLTASSAGGKEAAIIQLLPGDFHWRGVPRRYSRIENGHSACHHALRGSED